MDDFIAPSADKRAYYRLMAYNKRHGIPCLRTCKICGKQFEINNSFRRYCSAECKAEAEQRHKESLRVGDTVYTKTCKVCGKTFETRSPGKAYCSSRCADDAANALRREHRRRSSGVAGEVFCAFCHKPFKPSRLGHKFCSNNCACAFDHFHGDCTVREAKLAERRVCAWCGKEFRPRSNNQRYCSHRCQNGYLHHGRVSEAEYLAAKERKRAEREAASRSKCERKAVSRDGLTDAQVAEVIQAQDGDPSLLWKRSQAWTDKQRKFAKRRYCYIHGL